MHLKSLELYGFKSFAQKTRLHFEPGVTAIVGPNGCGKSNIADAIKWVLGEQSPKEMRGAKMEDVIFSGTDSKQPLNLAEVSLTLSNHDKTLPVEYGEVTITRRIFRSGESEYLINKSQVRLRDVLQLFMGTGIGTSAYSLLEQGEIDLIINSKPEDRRPIFEEASGITKYKSQKREALRKLEHTEDNLVRLTDIITEVKRQIGSIERQVQKAKRYKNLFEQVKDLDLKLAKYEHKEQNSHIESLNKKYNDIKHRESLSTSKLGDLNNKLEVEQQKLKVLENNLSNLKSEWINLDASIDKDTNKIALSTEQIRELQEREEQIKNEKVQINNKISQLNLRLGAIQKEKADLILEEQQKKGCLEDGESAISKINKTTEECNKHISNFKLNVIDKTSSYAKVKNELVRIGTILQSCTARFRRLSLEKDKVNEEFSKIESPITIFKNDIEDLVEKKENSKREKSELDTIFNRRTVDLANLSKVVADLERKQASVESKLELVTEAKTLFTGYSSGVKSLLNDISLGKIRVDGLCGVLADLLEAKPGYEKAIESVLSSNLESLVVERLEDGIDIVNFYSESKLGKVKFFALKSEGSPIYPISNEDEDCPQFAAVRAYDVVKCDEKYKGLVFWLLKGVYIVESLQIGLDIGATTSRDCILVAKTGQIIGFNFVTSGLPTGDNEIGLLNRDPLISKLSEQNRKILSELEGYRDEENQATEKNIKTKGEIEHLASVISEQEKKLIDLETQKGSLEKDSEKLKDEMRLLVSEIELISSEVDEYTNKVAELKIKSEEIEKENLNFENMILSNQKLIDDKSKQREELISNISRFRTELLSIAEKNEKIKSTIDFLVSSIKDEKSSIDIRSSQLDRLDSKISDIEQKNTDLQGHLDERNDEKVKVDQRYRQFEIDRENLSNNILRIQDEIKTEQDFLEKIRNQIHDLEMEKKDVSFKLDSIKTRITTVYNTDLDTFTIDVSDQINEDEMRSTILGLKGKLDSMGSVNLVAIEEHEGLQKRYNFLISQEEDLIKSKESLHKAITKINRTTRELFTQTFTKIQKEFSNLFRILFNGGYAQLALVDENNILESGIEIIARPPGKKLQSISLLSGGEKALTAIALLFAIFKVKPSPFCVLDEIDAPLDESNIGRFSRLLQEFLKSSQFIIITHNKKTIKLADILYGITMEIFGTSKIVSVRFKDDEEDIGDAEGAEVSFGDETGEMVTL